MAYDPSSFVRLSTSEAFVDLNRTGLLAEYAQFWDDELLREPRVCVPIDVQALYVPPGADAQTAGVRLDGPLSRGAFVAADADAEARARALAGPDPFAAAEPRPVGVHLHWAMPDALLRGTLQDPSGAPAASGPAASGGGLGLPPLPDRWLVLRLLLPETGLAAVATGWVVDALSCTVTPLADYAGTPDAATADTATIPAAGLTGTAGGTATWTAGYDAAGGRFTFHDPLDDVRQDHTLGGALPGGPVDGRATYLVVGWWSHPELDPLDEVRGTAALDDRLARLHWRRIPQPAYSLEPSPFGFEQTAGPAASSHPDLPIRSVGSSFAALASDRGLKITKTVVSDAVFAAAAAMQGALVAVTPAVPPRPEASTLVHGAVLGVPVLDELAGLATQADQRPDPTGTQLAVGESLADSVGAMTAAETAARLGQLDDEARDTVERLLTAFFTHRLPDLDDAAGAAAVDAAHHAGGFVGFDADEPPIVDRLVDGKASVPGRSRRIGTAGEFVPVTGGAAAKMTFAREKGWLVLQGGPAAAHTAATGTAAPAATPPAATPPAATPSAAREEPRPRLGRFVPTDPFVVVRGAGRSRRHGLDGDGAADGTLLVRHPSQLIRGFTGLIEGAEVLAALPGGAVPSEATALAREALLMSPHAYGWLARRASPPTGSSFSRTPTTERTVLRATAVAAVRARLEGELLLRFDAAGRYSTRAAASDRSGVSVRPFRFGADVNPMLAEFADAAMAHSLAEGVQPAELALTPWVQPWLPMWLEFEVEVDSAPVAAGTGAPDAVVVDGESSAWGLGRTDLEPASTPLPTSPTVLTVASRVPLTSGAATAVGGAIDLYLADEDRRDQTGTGEIDDALEGLLGGLADVVGAPDLLGASLDGVRRRLLGLPARALRAKDADGRALPERPDADPRLLVAGSLRVIRLRLLDAFGRVLDLDPDRAIVPARLTLPDAPARMLRPPRFTAPARVELRLVRADTTASDVTVPASIVDARVDEVDPAAAASPVAGFLLPDHVDESLEVFAADGTPLGELLVEGAEGASGGGVVWEPAPGRPLPVDAAPGAGLERAQASVGAFATGLVLADAAARGGERAAVGGESALSALIRAIDTSLWTLDPVAGSGSAELASITGRPLALVRALVSVDIAADVDALDLTPEQATARQAAFAELASVGVRVRLGDVARPDDGLVAWFVDDDFSRVHLADAAIADLGRPLGPGRGFLRTWGLPPEDWSPGDTPIEHPYLAKESELVVHPGAPRLVTLLMAPGAAVSVTSGVVPSSMVRLQRSWFAGGLDRLVPSLRVGPVLVDPGDVRLPLVAALGADQTLTVREGPTGWRDDAILAASSSALLPDRASVLREGWIRVTPAPAPPAP